MNREIIFRGKTTGDLGIWVYGNLIVRKFDSGKIDYLIENCEESDFRQYEVIPESVGQFTGATDKDGNKVFEGDILQLESGEEVAKTLIYWDDEISGFSDRRDFDGDSFRQHQGDFNWVIDSEIIGNIYDDLGLMEQEVING